MTQPAPALSRIDYLGVPFEVDDSRPSDPAWFVLGVRKSGSTMFNRAAQLMAKFNAVNWVGVPDILFRANVNVTQWQSDPESASLLRGGNVYGGFRNFPIGMSDAALFKDAQKVLLVRDPRDALVSEYFSTAFTHSVPQATGADGAREKLLEMREAALGMSADQFALKGAERMARTLSEYIPLLQDPRLLVYRYEDIIFDKQRLFRGTIEHFGWKLNDQQLARILELVDVKPAAEQSTQFIRKVTPGDHREKLSADTITEITEVLAAGMRAFGYS